jgi:2-polyprenyl-3-methyl-5-hydroxy-6-metoxy-1,4-benzoquinol methylase
MSVDRAADVYDEGYFRQYDESVGLSGDVGGHLRPHLRERLAEIESRIGVGRMLEIGCARGHLLEAARRRGWETRGVEPSEAAAREARAKGLDVYVGPVEAMPPLAEPVDFVHMHHVLEHLADPLATLRQVCELLKPTGLAIIEVPNEFDNLFFRFGRLILPERSLVYAIRSTHQFFFNPSTLRRMLTAAGLAIERCRTVRWTIGDRSGLLGRATRRAVYLLERRLGCAGNIEATVRRGEGIGAER